jgi:dihydrofolate synthase/folylpolyglutamate synthase
MTLAQALDFIHRTDWKGSRLGLDRMRTLMHTLGDPQQELKFLHVAGTNGKGSTAAMLASILTAAGYKTGLYTSPHLWRINERFSIDGTEISDEALCKAAEQVAQAAAAMDDRPTEFEILTATAFVYFCAQQCDYVVLEVGLGGRLDATNIIGVPAVAVLCNIGLEHTQILGDTLEKIAAEKAGIIKYSGEVVAYRAGDEVESVYRRICQDRHAVLHPARFEQLHLRSASLDGQVFDWPGLPALHLALPGTHQLCNAAVALEAVAVLRGRGVRIGDNAIRQGLSSVRWPGRFEVLSRRPLFIADGAHNPQCIRALADNLAHLLPDTPVVFLLGMLADKDYRQMLQMLIPYAKAFVCLTPDSDRAKPATELAQLLHHMGQSAVACDDVPTGIATAISLAGALPVVACGSLYLLGDIRLSFLSKK